MHLPQKWCSSNDNHQKRSQEIQKRAHTLNNKHTHIILCHPILINLIFTNEKKYQKGYALQRKKKIKKIPKNQQKCSKQRTGK